MTDLTPEALDALQERLRRIEWGVTGEPCAAGNVDETAALEADTAITALRAQLAEVEAERDAAIASMTDAARKRGEAEGKLAASEMAGVVEGWRDRAIKAEAALATARADAVRDAAEAANEADSLELALHGPAKIVERILALIDTPSPSAPSPEAVARAALEVVSKISAHQSIPVDIMKQAPGDLRKCFAILFLRLATDPDTIAAIIAKAGDAAP